VANGSYCAPELVAMGCPAAAAHVGLERPLSDVEYSNLNGQYWPRAPEPEVSRYRPLVSNGSKFSPVSFGGSLSAPMRSFLNGNYRVG